MVTKHDSAFYAQIVKYDGDEVVENMGPMSRASAQTVCHGANINLNHDDYYTRTKDPDGYEESNDNSGEERIITIGGTSYPNGPRGLQ